MHGTTGVLDTDPTKDRQLAGRWLDLDGSKLDPGGERTHHRVEEAGGIEAGFEPGGEPVGFEVGDAGDIGQRADRFRATRQRGTGRARVADP
ncbi:MAG: hypothetical protein R2710_07025 [Acidimicrobiales bacterium]